MINTNSNIQYANIVSKKYSCNLADFQKVLENFKKNIYDNNLRKKGNLFYSIETISKNKDISGELFLPIHETDERIEKPLYFHSYYCVENMLAQRVFNDFETNMEFAYSSLIELIKSQNLEIATPFYHEISLLDGNPIMTVKVGYRMNYNMKNCQ